jgi:alpha-1,2-mannosyltransferase
MVTLDRLLNRKRLAYAWITAVALWGAWLASILLGRGQMDLAGHVIGTDFLEFYTAGYTLRVGESSRLYDIAHQSQLQQSLIGPALKDYYAFITPPFFAWLYQPLSGLPYSLGFALWSLFGLLCLWASLRWLGAPGWRPFAWSLTFFPVFASVSYGQNSLLSLALLSLTYRFWRSGRLWAAGLVLCLLLYKPQLVLGVGILWLLDWRRQAPALAGLLLGAFVLACLSWWRLPAASAAYVEFARTILPQLPEWFKFPLWNLHSVRGFWLLLLPGLQPLADGLYLICALAGIAFFLEFWRRMRDRPALLYAAAICLTMWLTPHAMIYEWTLLLIPAVLLWQEAPELRDRWRPIFALIWLAALVSGPLTLGQRLLLPIAAQVSVLALGVAVYLTRRELLKWVVR